MKRIKIIISAFLAFAMIFTMSVSVFAQSATSEDKGKYQEIFEKLVEENVADKYNKIIEYRDCYEYYSKDNNTDIPDWALFYGYFGYDKIKLSQSLTGIYMYTVCGDYFMETLEISQPYMMSYYVYVPGEDLCYNLNEAFDAKLENIEYTFTKYILEDNPYRTRIIGDVDKDRNLTIMDVTLIQKHIAEIVNISCDQPLVYTNVYDPSVECLVNFADVDRDDMITVMDATAIQKRLVEIVD